jgi:hypothetical protein
MFPFYVIFPITLLSKQLITFNTLVRFNLFMESLVQDPTADLAKTFVAMATFVRFLTSVSSSMYFQVTLINEVFFTVLALMRLFRL